MKAARTFFLSITFVIVTGLVITMGAAKVLGYGLTARNTDSKDAPGCGDEKPKAPWLYYTEKVSNNQVKLVWDEVTPASSWTVAYGPASGQYIWGLNNYGNHDTRSIVINDLPGGTYYFVVRANNGCMPGPFSNEEAVSLGVQRAAFTGTQYTPPADTTGKPSPTVTPRTPAPRVSPRVTPVGEEPGEELFPTTAPRTPGAPSQPAPQPGFFQRIVDFILGLFGG